MIGTVFTLLLLAVVFADPPTIPLSNVQNGDRLSFTAKYSSTARRFGFQLLNAEGNAIYRLAFRHTDGDTARAPCTCTSNWNWNDDLGKRQYENIDFGSLPAFVDGELFDIVIECLDGSFKTSFNGVPIEGPASDRSSYGATLDQITSIQLWGGAPMDGDGNVGIYWKSFCRQCLSFEQHTPDPAEVIDGEED